MVFFYLVNKTGLTIKSEGNFIVHLLITLFCAFCKSENSTIILYVEPAQYFAIVKTYSQPGIN